MWLRGRYCLECGSGLVCWVYRQPHCFSCGANYPYEEVFGEDSMYGEDKFVRKSMGVWVEASLEEVQVFSGFDEETGKGVMECGNVEPVMIKSK